MESSPSLCLWNDCESAMHGAIGFIRGKSVKHINPHFSTRTIDVWKNLDYNSTRTNEEEVNRHYGTKK